MPFVDLEGSRVRYLDEGEGPPVVMLHGWGLAAQTWDEVIAALAPGYRCLALDWPGYGASAPILNPTVRVYAWVVEAFCAALGLERVTLMGHSMGGQIALLAAIHYPQRAARLVTLGAVITGDVYVSRLMRAVGIGGLYLAALPVVGRLLADLLGRVTPFVRWVVTRTWYGSAGCMDSPYFARDFRLWMRHDTVGTRLRNWPSMTGTDLLPRLAEVRVPVLMVHGESDGTVGIEQAHAAAARLPDVQLVTLPGVGHFPAHEQPGQFYPALRGWLRATGG
ncbi:MAG: alpha/beta hydrolase [Anaerolineae bacterium]|nr:alpha/beta hydrolase [Anaerolineae bacterium]